MVRRDLLKFIFGSLFASFICPGNAAGRRRGRMSLRDKWMARGNATSHGRAYFTEEEVVSRWGGGILGKDPPEISRDVVSLAREFVAAQAMARREMHEEWYRREYEKLGS